MFQRFTERARHAVVLAQDEARSLRHNYIGTEHLLLGLLREQDGAAFRILQSLDVGLADVRTEILREIGIGEGEVAAGAIPFTPRAKKVLDLANTESQAARRDYIGTEYVLLGIALERSGVAARVLSEIAEADDVCDAIVARLGGARQRTSHRHSRRWRVWR